MNKFVKTIISAAAIAAINYIFDGAKDGLMNKIDNAINKDDEPEITLDDDWDFTLDEDDDE